MGSLRWPDTGGLIKDERRSGDVRSEDTGEQMTCSVGSYPERPQEQLAVPQRSMCSTWCMFGAPTMGMAGAPPPRPLSCIHTQLQCSNKTAWASLTWGRAMAYRPSSVEEYRLLG